MQRSKIKNPASTARLVSARQAKRGKQNSNIDNQKIFVELKKVLDPELGINIVDLGLIYGIKIKDDKVTVKMTLTTPGCPLLPHFETEVKKAVKKVKNVKSVIINLTFNPVWTPEKMTKEARVQLGMV